VRELLDAVEAKGEMDVMPALAAPLPALVIADLLGVPREDYAIFKAWATDIVSLVGNPDPLGALARADGAMQALMAYLGEIIAKRRREPRDDLISAMIAAQEAHDALTDAELLATCNLLLLAGHETTTNLIGNGMLALLRNPDELDLLRREPARIPGATEELLRYDSPVQMTGRRTRTERVIGGTKIEAGQHVVVLIGSANRDPERFADPECLDVRRGDDEHLSFGGGSHYCLGASLARLEGQIAIGAIVSELPKLRLAAEELEWRETLTLRGLKALPVEF